MELKLLVGSDEFWRALRSDIENGTESVCVQTLSFEGDGTGMGLSEAMRTSRAPERKIIVDQFTKHFISDRWVYAPKNRFDDEHRAEVLATWAMIEENVAAGIEVKWVNPFGFLYHRAPVRNHKKMVLVDGHITYLGGINFSDHNFQWHDMMLRIDDPDVAAFMKKDFDATWAGTDAFSEAEFDGISITLIDGKRNEETFEKVFGLIDSAKESIFIESPYLSWPFYEYLRSAVKRGVEVTVLMPDANNRAWVQRYTEWEGARSGIHLRNYLPEMTHLKAMLVDEEVLVLGSSNFDYYSYRSQQEVVAIATDPTLVREFIERVRDPDLEQSRAADAETVKKSTVLLYGFIRAMGKLTVTLAKI
jgi:cardiolipin synthase